MAEVIDRGGRMLLKGCSTRTADVVVAMALSAKVRYTARLHLDKPSG
jgi:hypothetical protein